MHLHFNKDNLFGFLLTLHCNTEVLQGFDFVRIFLSNAEHFSLGWKKERDIILHYEDMRSEPLIISASAPQDARKEEERMPTGPVLEHQIKRGEHF